MVDDVVLDEKTIEDAFEFLKKFNVKKEILDKIEFSLSKKKNIKINAAGFGESVLLKNENGFQFPESIPISWFESSDKCIDLKKLLEVHPQKHLISELNCEGTIRRTCITIIPKKNIPFKLEEKIIAPGILQCDIYDWFSRKDLIKDLRKEICERAAQIIQKSFENIKQKSRKSSISEDINEAGEIIQLINISSFPKSVRFEKYKEYIKFYWKRFSLRYDINSESFSEIDEPYTQMLFALQKTQKAYARGKELKQEILDSGDNISCSIKLSLNASKVSLLVKYHNFKKEYVIENRAFARSAKDAWREHKKALKEDIRIDDENWKKIEPELRGSKCCGSLLAECIADTVLKNMPVNYGISLSSLVKKVRGLTTRYYEEGKYAGMFSLIPEQEVMKMIKEMKKFQLLKVETVSGEYTDYDKVRIDEELRLQCVSLRSTSKSCCEFNDQDWLHEIQNPTYKWNWNDILSLLEHPAVYCVNTEAFIKYFDSAPEDIVSYLKMTAKMGNRIKKKICKQIVSEIKLKSA